MNSWPVAFSESLLKTTSTCVGPCWNFSWISAAACCDGALGLEKPPVRAFCKNGVATTLTAKSAIHIPMTIHLK